MTSVLVLLSAAPGRWPGIDESVVARLARAAGRAPAPPFLGIEGDLLLFAFLCAGLCGGFTLGYCYRALFAEAGKRDAS